MINIHSTARAFKKYLQNRQVEELIWGSFFKHTLNILISNFLKLTEIFLKVNVEHLLYKNKLHKYIIQIFFFIPTLIMISFKGKTESDTVKHGSKQTTITRVNI